MLLLLLFERHDYTAILNALNLPPVCSVIFTCFHSVLSLQVFSVQNRNPSTGSLELLQCVFALKRVSDALVCLSVLQAYGRDLMEAQDWCRKYMRSGNVKDLTQAWDLYYHVFRRISKQLPQVGGANRGTHTSALLTLVLFA